MKRLFGSILVLMVLFALVGCGEAAEKSSSTPPQESYDIPLNGMYHEKTGIILLLGMTEEEVDQQIEKYGKEDLSQGNMRQILYNLGDVYTGFVDGELFSISSESEEWKMTGGICAGSTLNEIRKVYGNATEKFEEPLEKGVYAWRYSEAGIQRTMAYYENEDQVFSVSIADLSKFG